MTVLEQSQEELILQNQQNNNDIWNSFKQKVENILATDERILNDMDNFYVELLKDIDDVTKKYNLIDDDNEKEEFVLKLENDFLFKVKAFSDKLGKNYKNIFILKSLKFFPDWEFLNSFEHFDRELLNELFKLWKWRLISYRLEKFEWLDEKVALDLLELGEFYSVITNFEKFDWLSIKKLLDVLSIKWWLNVFSNYLDRFNWLEEDLAIELVRLGEGYSVIKNIDRFIISDFNNLIDVLIEKKSFSLIIQNLVVFKWINQNDLVIKLIDNWEAEDIVFYFEKFDWLDCNAIWKKIMSIWKSRLLVNNLKKFNWLGFDIANELVDLWYWEYIVTDLKSFDSDSYEKIANKLIDNKIFWSVVSNLDKFWITDYNIIVDKLLEEAEYVLVVYNLDKFLWIDHNDIITKLIEKWEFHFIIDNVDKFKSIDYNLMVDNFINRGEWRLITRNLKSLTWINHNDLLNKLFEKSECELIVYNIEKFEWLDHKDLLDRLLKNDLLTLVGDNLIKFEWVDYFEVVNKLVDNWYWWKVAQNLSLVSWLEEKVAVELIRKWHWNSVIDNLSSFSWANSVIFYLKYFPEINIEIFDKIYELFKEWKTDELEEFIGKIKLNQQLLIEWKSDIPKVEWIDYEEIVNFVYPKRNYSPNNLSDYEDKSTDLDNYIFNRDWYSFILNNLLWYKLIEGKKINKQILNDFMWNIENISIISKSRDSLLFAVNEYSKKEWLDLESTELESRILEYLLKKESRWNKIDINDFDLLIAYQLIWKYEEFFKWSNDKLKIFEDEETKYMIQIKALLDEYWDKLKESILKIERITLDSEDKKYFEKYLKETPKEVVDLTKQKTLNSLIKSFSNRPTETITDEVVKKSIDTKIKSILQTTDISEEEKLDFIQEFNQDDFKFWNDVNLQEIFFKKWIDKVEYHFWKVDNAWIDIRNIAKIQNSTFNKLQAESNKFEAIVSENAKDKDRRVYARFWKTRYDSYARWVWDVCIWKDVKMWKNKDYFELVLFDLDRQKNIWTVMLLNMQEDNWKKYLLFWPNPSVEFNDKVSSEKLFEQISKIIVNFASENNYDWVVFDPTHWRSTNRSWDFLKALEKSQIRDENWEVKKINLDKKYLLWLLYEYQNNLSYLWRK